MAYFQKSDLQYLDYAWHPSENHDDPAQACFPDNRFVTTSQGYEVLTFINAVARFAAWPAGDKARGHKLERLLRQDLPFKIRGRISVQEWALTHWDRVLY